MFVYRGNKIDLVRIEISLHFSIYFYDVFFYPISLIIVNFVLTCNIENSFTIGMKTNIVLKVYTLFQFDYDSEKKVTLNIYTLYQFGRDFIKNHTIL